MAESTLRTDPRVGRALEEEYAAALVEMLSGRRTALAAALAVGRRAAVERVSPGEVVQLHRVVLPLDA